MPRNIAELEEKIGYEFKNIKLLEKALTHSSYANELKAKKRFAECNERLEFLGDSVLSIIVSEYLYSKYAQSPEGELTKLRAAVVQSSALASYARSIELGDYLYLGVGEEKNGGRERQSNLENAFEALLAAIYIDAGENGKLTVKDFLLPFVVAEIKKIGDTGVHRDFKTELQQFIQQAEGDYLEYVTVDEQGPDHNKTFWVEARLNRNVIGKGSGKTKREAEQNAACAALELFGTN
ncbi:MAG: ribonuclease III [Clostridia bacterium]|nr:ribonuclease III [Clostridia bacterium]